MHAHGDGKRTKRPRRRPAGRFADGDEDLRLELRSEHRERYAWVREERERRHREAPWPPEGESP